MSSISSNEGIEMVGLTVFSDERPVGSEMVVGGCAWV